MSDAKEVNDKMMEPDLIDVLVAASGHSRADAAVIYYALKRDGWTLVRTGEKHVPKGAIPDFGTVQSGLGELPAIVPGKSLDDLMLAFQTAAAMRREGNAIMRGVRAVTDVILKAIYGE